jgi:hypothetical protein
MVILKPDWNRGDLCITFKRSKVSYEYCCSPVVTRKAPGFSTVCAYEVENLVSKFAAFSNSNCTATTRPLLARLWGENFDAYLRSRHEAKEHGGALYTFNPVIHP